MALQSNDELIRSMEDFATNFAPPDLILNDVNGKLIGEHCINKHGVVTISGLQRSYEELKAAGKLQLIPQPPVLTQLQKLELAANKEQERMQRDYLESIKPQESFEQKVKEHELKEAEKKKASDQAKAESELELAISGYQCYRQGGGAIDFSATDMVHKDLRTVVVRTAGKRDAIATLVAVRQIILELPDHPKMNDVARAVESMRNRNQS